MEFKLQIPEHQLIVIDNYKAYLNIISHNRFMVLKNCQELNTNLGGIVYEYNYEFNSYKLSIRSDETFVRIYSNFERNKKILNPISFDRWVIKKTRKQVEMITQIESCIRELYP